MNASKLAVSVCMAIALAATSTSATIMTFTLEGEGEGTLAGVPFPMSQFVFTTKADTANRQPRSYGWWIKNTSATISITGLGDYDLLSGSGIFLSTDSGVVGFCRSPIGTNFFYGPINTAFSTWDLLTPIGPISGKGYFSSWQSNPQINTTGGILLFDDGNTTMTFTAVPEPATLSLLALGGLVMMRKHR